MFSNAVKEITKFTIPILFVSILNTYKLIYDPATNTLSAEIPEVN